MGFHLKKASDSPTKTILPAACDGAVEYLLSKLRKIFDSEEEKTLIFFAHIPRGLPWSVRAVGFIPAGR